MSANETMPLLAMGNLIGKVKVLLLPAASEGTFICNEVYV